jgi:hypothetical protein
MYFAIYQAIAKDESRINRRLLVRAEFHGSGAFPSAVLSNECRVHEATVGVTEAARR